MPQDTPRRHPLEVVPPEPVASPGQVRPFAEGAEEDLWYTPTLGERMRLLGWRWLLLLPALFVIGLVLGGWYWRGELFIPLWFAGGKLAFIALALPVVLFFDMAKNAMRSRTDPFCIHCGYALDGLPDHHVCPECGRSYSFAQCDEYRRDPMWFRKRYQMRHMHARSHEPFHAGPVRSPPSNDGT